MKQIAIKLQSLFQFLQRHWIFITFLLLLGIHMFLQVYHMYPWIQFGFDQTDNAWEAQKILFAHDIPLIGMIAKGTTGFYIGPLYYYYISFFYWLTNMNPIASPIGAAVASVVTFLVMFFCIRKLFSTKIALIAVGIETFSYFIIMGDRAQWPVNFIPAISMLIFYALYKVCRGNAKYLILLGVGIGLSLHIHFTSVLYMPIILLSLPFFPRKKSTLLYGLLSMLVIIAFLLPTIYVDLHSHNSQGNSLATYLHNNYHGLHLRRVLQLVHDGFIEFGSIPHMPLLESISWVFLPLFSFVYFKKHKKSDVVFLYLCWLWILIPWIAFSTYVGEISNYYFYMTRPIALIVFAYLTYSILVWRYTLLKVGIVVFWLYFVYVNIADFTHPINNGLRDDIKMAQDHIKRSDPILPYQNFPAAYLYWYYTTVDKTSK